MNRSTLAVALMSLGTTNAAQPQDQQSPIYVTGAAPITHDAYARLPKLGKFRAWLPKKVDLSDAFPKPGFLGQQPDCVAWATAYAARGYLYGKSLGHQPSGPGEQMSAAYVYNRLRPAGSACDRSITVVDALNRLETEGVVSFADFPDDIKTCAIPAPATLRERASAFRLAD